MKTSLLTLLLLSGCAVDPGPPDSQAIVVLGGSVIDTTGITQRIEPRDAPPLAEILDDAGTGLGSRE